MLMVQEDDAWPGVKNERERESVREKERVSEWLSESAARREGEVERGA